MSAVRGLVVLTSRYYGVAGMWGLMLMTERLARRVLPASVYRWMLPLLWRALRAGLPADERSPGHHLEDAPAPEDRGLFEGRFPGAAQAKLAAADSILEHRFDLLGTGPRHWDESIAWHRDVKSGYVWPSRFWPTYGKALVPGNGADVKIPWELSRLHHMVVLAQAWWLSGDEAYSGEFFSQWESWLESNPVCHGINWTSAMEAAIRAVNLTYAVGLLDGCPGWTPERRAAINRAVRQHGVYIEHNLELGVREGRIEAGNHYLANLCGLAVLGTSWSHLPEASRWRTMGLDALEAEIERQVQPDGSYFEPSTSYHRLALELFLIPAVAARRVGHEMSDGYWRRLELMCEAVMHVTGPDGCVPQVGDNDDGRLIILSGYPDWPRHDHRYLLGLGTALFGRGDLKAVAGECPEEVFWLLGAEGVGAFERIEPEPSAPRAHALADAGLYAIRSADGEEYALIRAGTVPPSAPAGHAHNDALSLELWAGGRPLFVDPGTICYTSDLAVRDRLRSTVSHNTVMVDGQEINRLPAGAPFEIGRDSSVRVLEWQIGSEIVLVAQHDGYRRLPEPVSHRRTIRFRSDSQRWEIEDLLRGLGPHQATWFWHVSPGETVRLDGSAARVGATSVEWETDCALATSVQPSQHGSSYGRIEDSSVLVLSATWDGEVRLRTIIESAVPVGAAVVAAGRSEADVDG